MLQPGQFRGNTDLGSVLKVLIKAQCKTAMYCLLFDGTK